MSKAEDKAKEFSKKLGSHTTLYKGTIDKLEVYELDDVIWAYKEGYHQAEKDLELTWEDVKLIIDIVDSENLKPHLFDEIDYQEVLKRFNEQKYEDKH